LYFPPIFYAASECLALRWAAGGKGGGFWPFEVNVKLQSRSGMQTVVVVVVVVVVARVASWL